MSAPVTDGAALSAECRMARRTGYGEPHSACRQITDVPLPHPNG
ncbi:hypothetical protein AB0D59_18005 [Streptomyces sp. NPDC048417]